MAQFFIPGGDPAQLESLYAALAEVARVAVPDPGERIRSITFKQDAINWVATVGEHIRGVATVRRQRGGRQVDVEERREDTAIVQAIFPGNLIKIVTDAPPVDDRRSYWENPAEVHRSELRTTELFDRPAAPPPSE